MEMAARESLKDIQEVLAEVEGEECKTSDEKVRLFLQKIGNPYLYKVGTVTVRVSFAGSMSIDDCFANFLSAL